MTLLVNLFGGPGAGKSTMMAGIFSELKLHGINAEMAPEFAKELCWENRHETMLCQPYVFGKQLHRISRLQKAGVACIVTDSPLLLSSVYGGHWPTSFHQAVRDIERTFHLLDIIVHRVKPYNPKGRMQAEDEAIVLDGRIERVLYSEGRWFDNMRVPGNAYGVRLAVDLVRDALKVDYQVGG